MVARILKCFSSSMRRIAFPWPAIGRGAAVLLWCMGLGVACALAPFGVVRMRRPVDVLDVRANQLEGARTQEAARAPEQAAASMLQARFQALVDGDADRLESNYDTKSDSGLWSWEKESSRIEYLYEWSRARGVEIIEVRARLEVDSVDPEGSDAAWVEITEHATYVYRPVREAGTLSEPGDPADWTHIFGSRAVHVIELVRDGGDWKIRRDWYADPIGQEPYLAPCEYSDLATDFEQGSTKEPATSAKYDREAARTYAIAYAGVPVIDGSGKYNPKFRVYTFVGGDCANYASQVLEAGGLEQGYGWHYTSEGSAAWVRGEDLVWHLLATGRGRRLYSGTFAGAVGRSAEHPAGAISELEPGDIIAYESRGQISHVAVVVGKDPAGYVTIASHTSDRLFFPWDMGWNDSTVFWLIKITY